MKIVRFVDDGGKIGFGVAHEGEKVTRLAGDVFSERHDTGEVARVAKLLAPIEPRNILCIGLNYRRHAEEGKQAIPENPVLFMKSVGAAQNPGGSDRVAAQAAE